MVHLLRKYQQTLLIGVTFLVIVTFVVFWNGSRGGGMTGLGATTKVASIYGQTVTDTDIRQAVRRYQLAKGLGMYNLLEALSGNAENQQQALENFVWNSYVFDHEADALQVFPTDEEVSEALTQVPGFQTSGHFDPAKLTAVVSNVLPSLGFSDAVIDDLVRQEVRVQKVRALLGAAVGVTPSELDSRFALENEKMHLEVVRLSSADLAKTITVTDEDARKAYQEHKDAFRSAEMRKVAVAKFELTAAQELLKGKDRTDALQKVGNEAWDLAQAVADNKTDFAAAAKQRNAPVVETGFFSQAKPAAEFAKAPGFADAAFKLTAESPNSDVVEGQDGYYVLHLEGTVPSRQFTEQEAVVIAKPDMQMQRATQLMQSKGTETRTKMADALKQGKTFEQAASGLGLKPETIPPFALASAADVQVPDAEDIMRASLGLGTGQLSDYETTKNGGLIVYMSQREPVDRVSRVVGEVMLQRKFLRQREGATFAEWLRLAKEGARLQINQRG